MGGVLFYAFNETCYLFTIHQIPADFDTAFEINELLTVFRTFIEPFGRERGFPPYRGQNDK